MSDQAKKAYQIMQNPYYQNISDNPEVELVIENSDLPPRKNTNEQQKLASQRPRGTRIDDTGTRLQVKGGRNYTSRKLFIGRDELYDDVVIRGLRADGLSTKLGVKNHKDGIAQMLTSLFHDDPRLPVVEEHFKTQRQKSNCAKTMFATMTHEELQFLKAETFPSRIDVQVRDYLTNVFSAQPEKLQATVEVLAQIQQVFKVFTPHAEFLSNHNFQTRGFFLDIVLMTCSFLMQIIQDGDDNPESNLKSGEIENKLRQSGMIPRVTEEKGVKENKTAAEILLSVGSDILDNSNTISEDTQAPQPTQSVEIPATSAVSQTSARLTRTLQNDGDANENNAQSTTVVVEGTQKPQGEEDFQWTTVEMVDSSGNSRYVLIKTDDEDPQSISTVKILDMLQSQDIQMGNTIEVDQDATKLPTKTSGDDEVEREEVDDKLTLVMDAENDGGNLILEDRTDVITTSTADEAEQSTTHSPDIDVESMVVHEENVSLVDDPKVSDIHPEHTEEITSRERVTARRGIVVEESQDSPKRKLTVVLPSSSKRSRKRP